MIAAAVLETARGRWFLAEHARRNRHADTRLILEAIEKLERTIAHRPEMPETDRVRVDLVEMMNAIRRTKTEVAALQPNGADSSHFDQASLELDAIVVATEKATSDILAAAERVQEIAWTLREQGVDAAICDLIDAQATEVYQACSFQDITGQRTRKVVEVMRFLEARINAMIKIWRLDGVEISSAEGGIPAVPQLRGGPEDNGRIQQPAVDKLIGNERKPDVFWRDAAAPANNEPRNLGEFDLDDLVVFESNTEEQPGIGRGAQQEPAIATRKAQREPAEPVRIADRQPMTQVQPQPVVAAAPSVQPSDREDGVGALTYAERLALFG